MNTEEFNKWCHAQGLPSNFVYLNGALNFEPTKEQIQAIANKIDKEGLRLAHESLDTACRLLFNRE